MYEMTTADLIWNRACAGGGSDPRAGDRALAALLIAHGLTMNGGVLHAVECLTPSEMSDAQSGYRFFGLDAVADLLSRARRVFEADDDLASQESLLDRQYAALVPNDSSVAERFEKHWRENPSDFAPL
jgi:hypothetical protein